MVRSTSRFFIHSKATFEAEKRIDIAKSSLYKRRINKDILVTKRSNISNVFDLLVDKTETRNHYIELQKYYEEY